MASISLYSLYNGRKKVYIGITNDKPRREQEHKDDGKKFTRMEVEKRGLTLKQAEEAERQSLMTYARGHEGKLPKYNKQKLKS